MCSSDLMPSVVGREDCHVENVYFTNCHFAQVPYEQMHTKFAARLAALNRPLGAPKFKCVDNLVLTNTHFSVL